MATIQELEQAGARALAANNRKAAQYFADQIKSLESAGLNSEEELQQEPEGVIETTKVLADDLSNQFNNSIATFLGAPVDLI
jgi:glutamate/tyrosine decarboxylase-like PLP-dependent enzyme